MSLFPDYVDPVTTPVTTPVTVRPSRASINSTSSTAYDRQLMVAADGDVIPIMYGRQSIGAQIAVVTESAGYLYVLCVWCLGECEYVESVLLDDAEYNLSNVATYMGTDSQTADPTLAGLIDGYDDDLTGIFYSVIKILADEFPSSIVMIAETKKVYDPRTLLTEYSTNPALCLADMITNDSYGQGKDIDWDSVESVADDNDELIGGLKRRELNYAIISRSKTSNHVEAMRAYAGCFIVQDDEIKLVSDRPASVTRSLIAKDVIDGSLKIKKTGTSNIPTKMKVIYTDVSSIPWKDAEAIAQQSGDTENRESVVNMQGITTYAQARREAIERLNNLTLSDLIVTWSSFDESLADQVGDNIELSHPKGLTSKKLRLLNVVQTDIGRYKITGAEYDPLVYSDNLETEPTYPDTTIPSPSDPLPVENMSAVEELFQQGTGAYASRLRITWDAPDYPFIKYYRVVVKVGINIVFESNVTSTEIATAAVLELAQHDIEVSVYSGLTFSDSANYSVTPQGKYAAPGDVSSLSGFEAGGTVYLSWAEAIDIDIWKYEIRYGATGVTWANAGLIDRTDSLRLTTDEISAGTWDFLVKAIDSVSNYSDTEARKTLTVTLDDDSFLVGSNQFDTPTLTDMHEYILARSDTVTYAVTESGESWATLFPNAMDTYTNSLNSYQSDSTSEYLSETYDAGLQLSGDWSAEIDYTTISGDITSTLELSTDNSNWDSYPNLSAKATARYARVIVSSDVGLFIINWPDVLVRINAIPKSENGDDTSLASGGETILLTNTYSKAKTVTITPIGTTSLTSTYDNLIVSSTDLVSNGTFDTDTTDWADGGDGILTIDTARLKIENGNSWGFASQSIDTIIGETYTLSGDLITGDVDGYIYADLTTDVSIGVGKQGSFSADFVAEGTTTSIRCRINGGSIGQYTYFDNVKVTGPSHFDVYIFNSSGAQVANDFNWKFEGV